jgi:hypothetical protein
MNKALEKVREEILALIPPTLFFLITLSLVSLIRWLMLEGGGVPLSSPLDIALGALVLGKSVLLADLLPLINRFPDKPLMYNVTWKTAIYVLVSAGIHYLERLYDCWKLSPGFEAANHKLLTEMVWRHFWGIQIFLTILIFNYCLWHELVRVIGEQKVRAMFFGGRPDAPA